MTQDLYYYESGYFDPELGYYVYTADAEALLASNDTLDANTNIIAQSGSTKNASASLTAQFSQDTFATKNDVTELYALTNSSLNLVIDKIAGANANLIINSTINCEAVDGAFRIISTMTASVGKIVEAYRTKQTVSSSGAPFQYAGSGPTSINLNNTKVLYVMSTPMSATIPAVGKNNFSLEFTFKYPANVIYQTYVILSSAQFEMSIDNANRWFFKFNGNLVAQGGYAVGNVATFRINRSSTTISSSADITSDTLVFSNGVIDNIKFSNTNRSGAFQNYNDANTLLYIDFEKGLLIDDAYDTWQLTSTLSADVTRVKKSAVSLASTSSISTIASKVKGTAVSLQSAFTLSSIVNKVRECQADFNSQFNSNANSKRLRSGEVITTSFFTTNSIGLRIRKSTVAVSTSFTSQIQAGKTVRGAAVMTSSFTQFSAISEIRGVDLFAFTNAQLTIQVKRIRDNNVQAASFFTSTAIVTRTRYISSDEFSAFDISAQGTRVRFTEAAVNAAFLLSADSEKYVGTTANLSANFTSFVDASKSATEAEAALDSNSQLVASAVKVYQLNSDLNNYSTISVDANRIRNSTADLDFNLHLNANNIQRLRNSDSYLTAQSTVSLQPGIVKQFQIDCQALFAPVVNCSAFVNDNAVLVSTSQLTAVANVYKTVDISLTSNFNQTIDTNRIKSTNANLIFAISSSIQPDWLKLGIVEPIINQFIQQTSFGVIVPFDSNVVKTIASTQQGGVLRGAFLSARMFTPVLLAAPGVIVNSYAYTVNDPGPGITFGWFTKSTAVVNTNVKRGARANLLTYNSLGVSPNGILTQMEAQLASAFSSQTTAKRTRRSSVALVSVSTVSKAQLNRRYSGKAQLASAFTITPNPKKVKAGVAQLVSTFIASASPSRYYPRPFGTWTANINIANNKTYDNWNYLEVNNLQLTSYSGTSSASQTLFSVSGHTLTRTYSVGPTRNYLSMDGTTYDISGITPSTGTPTIMKLIATRNQSTIVSIGGSNYSFPTWTKSLTTTPAVGGAIGTEPFTYTAVSTTKSGSKSPYTNSFWGPYLLNSISANIYDNDYNPNRNLCLIKSVYTLNGSPKTQFGLVANWDSFYQTATGQGDVVATSQDFSMPVTSGTLDYPTFTWTMSRTTNAFIVTVNSTTGESWNLNLPLTTAIGDYNIDVVGFPTGYQTLGGMNISSSSGLLWDKPNSGYIQTGLYTISGQAITSTPTELFITNSNYSTSQQIQASPRLLNDQTGVLGLYHNLYGADDTGVRGQLSAAITGTNGAKFTLYANGSHVSLARAQLQSTSTITAVGKVIRRPVVNTNSLFTQTTRADKVRNVQAQLQTTAQITASAKSTRRPVVTLVSATTLSTPINRTKQFSAAIQTRASELVVVARTGRGLITLESTATVQAQVSRIARQNNLNQLQSTTTVQVTAMLAKVADATLTATSTLTVQAKKYNGFRIQANSQFQQDTNATRLVRYQANLQAFATELAIGWYIYQDSIQLGIQSTLTINAVKTVRTGINLQAFASELTLGDKLKFFEAHLQAFNTVLAVGRVFTVDPYYQIKIERETNNLWIVPETRLVSIDSEQRGLKVATESRLLTINEETRVNIIKGYPQ